MEIEDWIGQETKFAHLQYKDRFRLYCLHKAAGYAAGALTGLLGCVLSLSVALAIYLRSGVIALLGGGIDLGIAVGFLIAAIVRFVKAGLKEKRNLENLDDYALKEFADIQARKDEKKGTELIRSLVYLFAGIGFSARLCISFGWTVFFVIVAIVGLGTMAALGIVSKRIYLKLKKQIIRKEYLSEESE